MHLPLNSDSFPCSPVLVGSEATWTPDRNSIFQHDHPGGCPGSVRKGQDLCGSSFSEWKNRSKVLLRSSFNTPRFGLEAGRNSGTDALGFGTVFKSGG